MSKWYSWTCPQFSSVPAVSPEFHPLFTALNLPSYCSACRYSQFATQSSPLKMVCELFVLTCHCLSKLASLLRIDWSLPCSLNMLPKCLSNGPLRETRCESSSCHLSHTQSMLHYALTVPFYTEISFFPYFCCKCQEWLFFFDSLTPLQIVVHEILKAFLFKLQYFYIYFIK